MQDLNHPQKLFSSKLMLAKYENSFVGFNSMVIAKFYFFLTRESGLNVIERLDLGVHIAGLKFQLC